jgi:hypothetical protein
VLLSGPTKFLFQPTPEQLILASLFSREMLLQVAFFHLDGGRQNLCVIERKAHLSPIGNPFRSVGIRPWMWLNRPLKTRAIRDADAVTSRIAGRI